jgi:hypothetical protein
MFTMFRNQSFGALLGTQLPPFLIAFITAELFFKWKSFALECLGFLALWFVLDAAYTGIRSLLRKRSEAPSSSNR